MIVTTSWDDGSGEDLRLAKLLKKYALTGTFYIPIESSYRGLSDADIQDIGKDHEVGAHTIHHISLAGMDKKRQKHEIEGSKKMLEKVLGNPVQSFCYPNGKYDNVSVQAVRESGFTYARTIERFSLDITDPFQSGTTIQTILFKADAPRFLKACSFNPLSLKYMFDWQYFARKMFAYAKHKKGIFHLWGHSWEIQERKQWRDLEKFFQFLAGQDITPVTNSELVAQ